MNLDQKSLDERVAHFAALADPLRLRIVDALALGDLSPTELQHRLGATSNLLAHHLGVLEQGGIVERVRSEGDRRRSYVRLLGDAFEGLLPTGRARARRVLFVCTANSARSQLAAALWAGRSTIPAASAGTRPAPRIDPGALAVAARHGLTLADAVPIALSEVARDDDLVITVCDAAHEELAPIAALHWSIPDPVRVGSAAAFDAAFSAIADRVDGLAPRLHAERSAHGGRQGLATAPTVGHERSPGRSDDRPGLSVHPPGLEPGTH